MSDTDTDPFTVEAESSRAAATGVAAILRSIAETIEAEHPEAEFAYYVEVRETDA